MQVSIKDILLTTHKQISAHRKFHCPNFNGGEQKKNFLFFFLEPKSPVFVQKSQSKECKREVSFVFSDALSYPHRCSAVGSDGSRGNSDRCGHVDCSHTLHDHKCFCFAHIHLSPLLEGKK